MKGERFMSFGLGRYVDVLKQVYITQTNMTEGPFKPFLGSRIAFRTF